MLTDEQAVAAQAEYDSLPGMPPDGFSWAWLEDIDNTLDWVRDQIKKWEGMAWMRVTKRDEDDTLWLEVWKERPRKEAPFNPPYTYSSAGE